MTDERLQQSGGSHAPITVTRFIAVVDVKTVKTTLPWLLLDTLNSGVQILWGNEGL